MKSIDIHQAGGQLSRLAERVERGETIVVARAGKPCMDLVPHQARGTPRMPGRLKGRIRIAPDFDQTFSEAELREILEEAVKPARRVRLGTLLAAIGHEAGLSDEEFASLRQACDRMPAEPSGPE